LETGATARLTPHAGETGAPPSESAAGAPGRTDTAGTSDAAPRPEACVFSPDGRRIAYVRRVPSPTGLSNQIFVLE
jgi:hypothetical protein